MTLINNKANEKFLFVFKKKLINIWKFFKTHSIRDNNNKNSFRTTMLITKHTNKNVKNYNKKNTYFSWFFVFFTQNLTCENLHWKAKLHYWKQKQKNINFPRRLLQNLHTKRRFLAQVSFFFDVFKIKMTSKIPPKMT